MKRVFVGFLFDKEEEKSLIEKSKTGVQTAANQYQHGFIDGLADGNLTIISALSVGTFPRLNKRLFFGEKMAQKDYGKLIYLKFINLPFFKERAFEKQVCKIISHIIEESQDEGVEIFFYSLYIPFLKAMEKLRKRYGDSFRACLIIPDLPGRYGIMRKKFSLRGIKDRLEIKRKMSSPSLADEFVFLTEPTSELFEKKPYCVIEGFLPECDFNYANERQKKTVLYTGSLNPKFGIQTLIEAFELIEDKDCELWICGAGVGQKEAEEASRRDPRIVYKGFLPKSEISDLQTRCDVLINPRPAEGEFTKYSFPSKTMEYILSGSKVLMHKLDGVGEEYYKYIRAIDEHTPEAIAKAITSAFADDNFYNSKYTEQIDWIKNSKNSRAQVEKLVTF